MIGQLSNDINTIAMQFEETSVFTKKPIGGFVERVDVSLDVSRLVPGQLPTRLHLSIDVSDTLLEVLEFLEDHTLLRVDDFLPHIIVKIGDFLQTQCFLIVSLSLLCSFDDFWGYLAFEP